MLTRLITPYVVGFLVILPGQVLAQSYDGQWQVSESVNATACGEGTYTESYTATVLQTGSQMSVSANGITRTGTLSGNTLRYSVTFDEEGGTNTGTGSIIFNGTTASGNSSWSWTNGSLTCSGTSTISATRVSAPTPTPEPTPTPTPTPPPTPAAPGASVLSFETSGNTLTVSWSAVSGATGYKFYYAPYPAADPVAFIDVGAALSISGDLPTNSAFYMAVQSYNAAGEGELSNVANFLIKGVDVIEVANSSSDIAAIVYGKENASAVIFNEGSSKSTRMKFSDNTTATLVSDGQGNPVQFDIAGYNVAFVYAGGLVRTTLTEPGGSQSGIVQTNLTAALELLDGNHSDCSGSDTCIDIQAASVDAGEAEAIEQSLANEGVAMERISGTVLACGGAAWMPANACEAMSGYLEQTTDLVDRMTDRVNSKFKRLANRFNCLVESGTCADVVLVQAPATVAELNQFHSAQNLPTAAFNVEADALKPDPDSWATYLAESGFSMVDVPCEESVFASIRPECGETGGSDQTPDSPIGSGGGLDISSEIDKCITDTYFEGCYNADGIEVGTHTNYSTSNGRKVVRSIHEYSGGNQTVRWYNTYTGALTGISFYIYGPSSDQTMTWLADGQWETYGSNGALDRIENWRNGKRHGLTQNYNSETGVVTFTGNWVGGKADGEHKTYYQSGTLARTEVWSNGVFVSSVTHS